MLNRDILAMLQVHAAYTIDWSVGREFCGVVLKWAAPFINSKCFLEDRHHWKFKLDPCHAL